MYTTLVFQSNYYYYHFCDVIQLVTIIIARAAVRGGEKINRKVHRDVRKVVRAARR